MYQLTRGFSRQHRIMEFASDGYASPLRLCVVRICLHNALQAYTSTTTHWPHYLPASPHRLTTTAKVTCIPFPPPEGDQSSSGRLVQLPRYWARIHGYGNINPLSIDYACRPRLRSRLTLGGLTCPRNPWSSGGQVSHLSFATHACILTPTPSTPGSLRRFHGCRTLPYPPTPLHHPPQKMADDCVSAAASAVYLSPATLSAQDHLTSELLRTLSRVAASKPTSWLSSRPHILFHLVHA